MINKRKRDEVSTQDTRVLSKIQRIEVPLYSRCAKEAIEYMHFIIIECKDGNVYTSHTSYTRLFSSEERLNPELFFSVVSSYDNRSMLVIETFIAIMSSFDKDKCKDILTKLSSSELIEVYSFLRDEDVISFQFTIAHEMIMRLRYSKELYYMNKKYRVIDVKKMVSMLGCDAIKYIRDKKSLFVPYEDEEFMTLFVGAFGSSEYTLSLVWNIIKHLPSKEFEGYMKLIRFSPKFTNIINMIMKIPGNELNKSILINYAMKQCVITYQNLLTK